MSELDSVAIESELSIVYGLECVLQVDDPSDQGDAQVGVLVLEKNPNPTTVVDGIVALE